MKQVFIRDMTEEDIQSVLTIEKMSFSFPWTESSFFNEVRKPRSFAKVALLNDEIAGYLCAECVLDEAHILDLAVHPDYRRMGIATALVEQILEELKEKACRFLYLEVRASNYLAKRLYQGFGFRIVGTRKKYYVSPIEDAVIMMREV
ncbi:MAG TPA: ribosomal protein S18-alanine N-acetyltransferase [Thermodesulfovibrionales bacterium]|nr:ribosomal protein S18-alanine N-acetyltransferase [Thermodesulfovibrionales bacterium]